MFQTDSSKKFQEIAKYSYDRTNMRTRAIEEVQSGIERDYYDVIHLYKEVSHCEHDLLNKTRARCLYVHCLVLVSIKVHSTVLAMKRRFWFDRKEHLFDVYQINRLCVM